MIAMAGGGSITTGATLSRGMSSPINSEMSQTKTIMNAISNMPSPVVAVREIAKGTNRVKVKESIKNL